MEHGMQNSLDLFYLQLATMNACCLLGQHLNLECWVDGQKFP